MEIYWRDNFTCPSEEEYEIMTKRSDFYEINIFVYSVDVFLLF